MEEALGVATKRQIAPDLSRKNIKETLKNVTKRRMSQGKSRVL